eukprot:scaffold29657_cov54-Phaeocystis_antarctica.AAC.3
MPRPLIGICGARLSSALAPRTASSARPRRQGRRALGAPQEARASEAGGRILLNLLPSLSNSSPTSSKKSFFFSSFGGSSRRWSPCLYTDIAALAWFCCVKQAGVDGSAACDEVFGEVVSSNLRRKQRTRQQLLTISPKTCTDP